MKKTWTPTMTSVAARIVACSSARLPRPPAIQWPTIATPSAKPGHDHGQAEQETVLEPDAAPDPLERRIAVAELVHGVGPAAEAEPDELRADNDEQRASDQRVDVELAPEDRRVRKHDPHEQHANRADQHAGEQEQEVRVVDEHQPEVTPAVPEGRELRLTLAGVESDRQLADLEAAARGADHHLGGELHPGRLKGERGQDVAPERPHAAMRVAHRRAKEEVQEAGEQRIADPAEHRHRARLNCFHAVPHHQLRAVRPAPGRSAGSPRSRT